MSYHVSVEPMPNNPARQSAIADSSGQWRVVIIPGSIGAIVAGDRVVPNIHSEGLPHEEACVIANKLRTELQVH